MTMVAEIGFGFVNHQTALIDLEFQADNEGVCILKKKKREFMLFNYIVVACP